MAVRAPIVSLLGALIFLSPATAVEIDSLSVTKEGGVYRVQMTFTTTARADQVIEVLTDFQNPQRLNADVIERAIINQKNSVTRVHTTLRSCFLIFCRDLDMLQDVTSSTDEVIAVIVPEQSDFRSGTWHWTVSATGDGSINVSLDASMEPDVFVPPFYRRMLEREVRAIANNLDAEASRPTP